MHRPYVLGQTALVDKRSRAAVMFASKLRCPMGIAEVTLKNMLECELLATAWFQATDWFLVQMHNPNVPGQTPWVSKRCCAVVILALQLVFAMSYWALVDLQGSLEPKYLVTWLEHALESLLLSAPFLLLIISLSSRLEWLMVLHNKDFELWNTCVLFSNNYRQLTYEQVTSYRPIALHTQIPHHHWCYNQVRLPHKISNIKAIDWNKA